jgi:menaquinone-specific isochorismate synthase
VDVDHSFWESGAISSLTHGRVLVAWGNKSSYSSFSELDVTKPAFYYPDFFLKAPLPWIQFSDWRIVEVRSFIKEIISSSFSEIKWSLDDKKLFQNAFEELKILFEKKQLKKAVPYVFARSSENMHAERLKKTLKQALLFSETTPLHLYGYWNSQQGMLGITPEILFLYDEVNKSLIKTMALAGTKKEANQVNLFKDPKELFEHQLVVEGIAQSLSKFGEVMIGKLQLMQLPRLTHLMTPIELQLRQSTSFESLIEALHPTPALGSFPKQQGEEWLRNYQSQLDRKSFGAPVGFSFPEQKICKCHVAIRNVQWDSEGMQIGAGCGVVLDSQFDQEWKEICLKLQAIKSGLDL